MVSRTFTQMGLHVDPRDSVRPFQEKKDDGSEDGESQRQKKRQSALVQFANSMVSADSKGKGPLEDKAPSSHVSDRNMDKASNG